MIASCPRCEARYRIDVARLRPEGARLRCARCEAVFRVSPPSPPKSAEAPPPAAAVPEPPPPEPRAGKTEPSPGTSRLRVLIADPEVENGKANAQVVASWGLEPVLVHDGVDAILTIQRTLPRAVVLDAALPKMFGFQICELMKRNESLRSIQVVLVGAIHDRDRYRRPPSELYGADAYVERPQLPDALRSILEGFGLPVGEPSGAAAVKTTPPQRPPVESASASPSVAPAAEPAPQPAPPPPAPASAPPAATQAPVPADTAADPELQKAERLARIVVSDIVLYNEEKFAAAVAAGNVLEAMDANMDEGRALFRQRIGERVRGSRDFLADEILRVARLRGMK